MTEPTIRIAVDLTNPGQYFACCGLLELADRLWPDAEGWFDNSHFHVSCEGTLAELFAKVTQCELTNTMTSAQHDRFRELSKWNKARRKEENVEDELAELSRLIREAPIVLKLPFNITIDWFTDEWTGGSRLKTWAGQQSVLNIARSMKEAIPCENESFEVALGFSAGECGLPFNFDSDLGSQGAPIDIGFSFDPLAGSSVTRIGQSARPVLEFLAFIGLQRFRPHSYARENRFGYGVWSRPLPLAIAMAAACLAVPMQGTARFEFRLLYRTQYLKSFLPAYSVDGGSHG